ncbi:MAG: tetratricopeptide repeat protein, partial [Elsteraceae bacterium]
MASLYPSFFTAPVARLDQGLAAHREGRLNEAEIHYRAVLQAEPDHPEALHYLGVIAHQTGGHDQAIALITRSLQLRPDANATNSLGEALRAVGRLTEALAAYEATLLRDPTHPAALGNCGLALRQLGRPTEAEQALIRAIPISPHWLDLHRHLGELRLARGDVEGALAAFEGALAQSPGNVEFLALTAETLTRLGHLEVALTRLDAAAPRRPARADLDYDRGVLLRRLNPI